jgi:uncharacterized protein YqhQ
MAFGNGVLMRGPRSWAWARDDGSVLAGRHRSLLTRSRWLRLPFVRSLVLFGEMIALSLHLHRLNGFRRGTQLALWLALCFLAELGLGLVLPLLIANVVAANVVLAVLSLGVGLAALREGMGRSVWCYHGAEHKAVNAYEAATDLRDIPAVMGHSRIHDRCGTNLVVIMFLLLLLGYLPVAGATASDVFGVLYGVVAIVLSLEFFRLVTRSPRSRTSRIVLSGGRALQRVLTTREPELGHVELACAALRRVLDLESGATGDAK